MSHTAEIMVLPGLVRNFVADSEQAANELASGLFHPEGKIPGGMRVRKVTVDPHAVPGLWVVVAVYAGA